MAATRGQAGTCDDTKPGRQDWCAGGSDSGAGDPGVQPDSLRLVPDRGFGRRVGVPEQRGGEDTIEFR